MNLQLIKADRKHELELNGRIYKVRPIDVQAALLTIHYSEDALRGDEDALRLIRSEAYRNLPLLLFIKLFGVIYRPRKAVIGTMAMAQLVQLGIEASKEEVDEKLSMEQRYRKAIHSFRETAWNIHIADAAYHFSMTPEAILRRPWMAFLEYITMTSGLRARTELSLIGAKSLPYIEKDHEREKAFDELHKRAGMAPPSLTEDEKQEQQRANLDRIASIMGNK